MRLAICPMIVAVVVAAGCEGNISPAPQTAEMAAGAPAPPEPAPPGDPKAASAAPAAAAPTAPEVTTEAAAASPTVPEEEESAAAPPEAADGPQGPAEVAKVGVGAKGRDYGGPGFVTTPIQQYFRARDRIELDIKLANAMKLYKAGNDNKGPESHEEFMDVIIKDNAVQLPELPMGDEYFYDAETEQLMVKHPAN